MSNSSFFDITLTEDEINEIIRRIRNQHRDPDGIIDVHRNGTKHGALHLDPFCGAPSPATRKRKSGSSRTCFTVTRQLRCSRDEAQWGLDIGLFINGLPVFTLELKNDLTK